MTPAKQAKHELLCPNCYTKMKPVLNKDKIIIYYECPKCQTRVLYSMSGH